MPSHRAPPLTGTMPSGNRSRFCFHGEFALSAAIRPPVLQSPKQIQAILFRAAARKLLKTEAEMPTQFCWGDKKEPANCPPGALNFVSIR